MDNRPIVLVVMDKLPLRALLQLSLEQSFFVELALVSSPEEASSFLDEHGENVLLIISDFNFGLEENQSLLERKKKFNQEGDFVLLLEVDIGKDLIKERSDIKTIFSYREMLATLNNNIRYLLPRGRFHRQGYVKVSLAVISLFCELPGDVYIEDVPGRLVKLLVAGAKTEIIKPDDYENSEMDSLFVTRSLARWMLTTCSLEIGDIVISKKISVNWQGVSSMILDSYSVASKPDSSSSLFDVRDDIIYQGKVDQHDEHLSKVSTSEEDGEEGVAVVTDGQEKDEETVAVVTADSADDDEHRVVTGGDDNDEKNDSETIISPADDETEGVLISEQEEVPEEKSFVVIDNQEVDEEDPFMALAGELAGTNDKSAARRRSEDESEDSKSNVVLNNIDDQGGDAKELRVYANEQVSSDDDKKLVIEKGDKPSNSVKDIIDDRSDSVEQEMKIVKEHSTDDDINDFSKIIDESASNDEKIHVIPEDKKDDEGITFQDFDVDKQVGKSNYLVSSGQEDERGSLTGRIRNPFATADDHSMKVMRVKSISKKSGLKLGQSSFNTPEYLKRLLGKIIGRGDELDVLVEMIVKQTDTWQDERAKLTKNY